MSVTTSFADDNDPKPPPSTIEIMELITAFNSSFFIDAQRAIWACGNNSYNHLGYQNASSQYLPVKVMDNVNAIATGKKHKLFLKSDGTLRVVDKFIDLPT